MRTSPMPKAPPSRPRWLATIACLAVGSLALALALALSGVSVGTASAATRWTAPVTPIRVVGAFDLPAQRWLPGHRGVDLLVPHGSDIAAAGSGRVVFAGSLAGRGVISIDHGDLRTTYEPVDPVVAPGSLVTTGQKIGTIGDGGHCGGRCLHWGLLSGSQYRNPMLLLRPGPTVLKPLPSIRAHRLPAEAAAPRVRAAPAPTSSAEDPAGGSRAGPASAQPDIASGAVVPVTAVAVAASVGAAAAARRRRRRGS